MIVTTKEGNHKGHQEHKDFNIFCINFLCDLCALCGASLPVCLRDPLRAKAGNGLGGGLKSG